LEFGDIGFCGGRGKLESLEKNPWSKARTNNKLNLHLAPGRIKPGPRWWEASTLTSAPSLLPIFIVTSVFTEYQFLKHFIMDRETNY